jgi:hypothetical protein
MAKNNQPGKTTDEETDPDPEIWAAIRDLDPDRNENESDVACVGLSCSCRSGMRGLATDSSRAGELAQGPTPVGKSGERSRYLDCSERQQRTSTSNKSRQNGSSNGSSKTGVKPEGAAAQSQSGSELNQRIAALQETVGVKLYRWVLREDGQANQPQLVRDILVQVVQGLESIVNGSHPSAA